MRAETEQDMLAALGTGGVPTGSWPPFPAATYLDPEVYRRDVHAVIGRAWHPVMRLDRLPEPGSWRTVSIAHWRLLVLRDDEGAFRAFHNVCRHRAALVTAARAGCDRQLVCPFHGFIYGLDGRLKGMREAPSYGALPREDHGLLPVTSATRWGWLWVRLSDDGPSLEDFLGEELTDHLSNWPLDQLVTHNASERVLSASWRVANEGFLESLHLPSVHGRSFDRVLHTRKGALRAIGDHSVMYSPFRVDDLYEPDGVLGRHAAQAGIHAFPGLNRLQMGHALVYHIFPTTTFNLLPNHITVAQFWPMDVGRCRLDLLVLGAPGGGPAFDAWYAATIAGHEHVVDEDDAIFDSVQQGLEAGVVGNLPLSSWEGRVHHLRQRLQAWHEREGGPPP